MDAEQKQDGVPPAAAILAIGAALGEGEAAAQARDYLNEQTKLTRLQVEDMRREDRLRHWSVLVRHISDVLRLAFEMALAIFVIGFVVAVASIVWTAMHDDSLVIEPFTVPPQMASDGLSGRAIAAQLQDKLASMQNTTDSGRPAKSYANDWGDGIKVLIPDTGISVGDLYRTLAGWMGSQTHITGEVYRIAKGIAITARSNGVGGTTITGTEADFDNLLQKSAEAIYQHTQPYRYAVYVASTGNVPHAMSLYRALAANGDREDRLWSHMGIATTYELTDPLQAPDENRKALAIDPDFVIAWQNIANEEYQLGHLEQALAGTRKTISLFQAASSEVNDRARAISMTASKGFEAALTGDFQAALKEFTIAADLPDYSKIAETSRAGIANALSQLHEPGASKQAWTNALLPTGLHIGLFYVGPVKVESDSAINDPPATIADTKMLETQFAAIVHAFPAVRAGADAVLSRNIWPYTALAKARLGQFAAAHTLIDKTPRDCYVCLRMRGNIRALEKNWPAATYWFTRAVKQAPSIPFAYADWGAMLLQKGDLDGAIAKFESAHKKGSHFADPLEMWGEALMQKNRSDLALAKFAEAAKYAPNWGRLHLKWGEALFYSGDKAGAQKQFAITAKLDLTSSEKSELAQMTKRAGVGTARQT